MKQQKKCLELFDCWKISIGNFIEILDIIESFFYRVKFNFLRQTCDWWNFWLIYLFVQDFSHVFLAILIPRGIRWKSFFVMFRCPPNIEILVNLIKTQFFPENGIKTNLIHSFTTLRRLTDSLVFISFWEFRTKERSLLGFRVSAFNLC